MTFASGWVGYHLFGADGSLIELAGALGDVGGAKLVSGEVAVAAPVAQPHWVHHRPGEPPAVHRQYHVARRAVAVTAKVDAGVGGEDVLLAVAELAELGCNSVDIYDLGMGLETS